MSTALALRREIKKIRRRGGFGGEQPTIILAYRRGSEPPVPPPGFNVTLVEEAVVVDRTEDGRFVTEDGELLPAGYGDPPSK